MLSNYYKKRSFDCFVFIIGAMFFFSSFNIYAQEIKANVCEQIYGTWETYHIQLPFRMTPHKKSQIWIFNDKGILKIDNRIISYKTEDGCSKLIIGNDPDFFSVEISNDLLFLCKIISLHESYNIQLKKVN